MSNIKINKSLTNTKINNLLINTVLYYKSINNYNIITKYIKIGKSESDINIIKYYINYYFHSHNCIEIKKIYYNMNIFRYLWFF